LHALSSNIGTVIVDLIDEMRLGGEFLIVTVGVDKNIFESEGPESDVERYADILLKLVAKKLTCLFDERSQDRVPVCVRRGSWSCSVNTIGVGNALHLCVCFSKRKHRLLICRW
jgi:hypothetical protein